MSRASLTVSSIVQGVNSSTAASSLSGTWYMSSIVPLSPRRKSLTQSNAVSAVAPKSMGKPSPAISCA